MKFTLYVSNYGKNILTLKDISLVDCYCENKDEKCYFRFEDDYYKNNDRFNINGTVIIFNTKFYFEN